MPITWEYLKRSLGLYSTLEILACLVQDVGIFLKTSPDFVSIHQDNFLNFDFGAEGWIQDLLCVKHLLYHQAMTLSP